MNNDPDANPELARVMKVARFRYGLIAPVLQNTYPDRSAAEYYRRVTAKPQTLAPSSISAPHFRQYI